MELKKLSLILGTVLALLLDCTDRECPDRVDATVVDASIGELDSSFPWSGGRMRLGGDAGDAGDSSDASTFDAAVFDAAINSSGQLQFQLVTPVNPPFGGAPIGNLVIRSVILNVSNNTALVIVGVSPVVSPLDPPAITVNLQPGDQTQLIGEIKTAVAAQLGTPMF